MAEKMNAGGELLHRDCKDVVSEFSAEKVRIRRGNVYTKIANSCILNGTQCANEYMESMLSSFDIVGIVFDGGVGSCEVRIASWEDIFKFFRFYWNAPRPGRVDNGMDIWH